MKLNLLDGSRRCFTLVTVLMALLLFLFFFIAGTILNRETEEQLASLLAQEQVLQTMAVRNAVSENISRLTNESTILAEYSFTEYDADLRTYQSMENLLEIELQSYRDVSAYSYRDFGGKKSISMGRESPDGRLGLHIAADWEKRYAPDLNAARRAPVIPPLLMEDEAIFLGFVYPVIREGRLKGSFTVVINLEKPLERYLNPLLPAFSGTPLILDQNLLLLWSENDRYPSRVLSKLFPAYRREDFTSLGNSAAAKAEGNYWLRPSGKEGEDMPRLNLSWSRLKLQDRYLLIALLSGEEELSRMLANHRRQRILLYIVLTLALGLITFGVLRIQKIAWEKRFLQHNQEALAEKVEEKTAELNNLLQRYSALFESANDAILLMENGRIVECNGKALELFETSTDEILGLTPADLSPPQQPNGSDSPRLAEQYLKNAEKGKPQLFEWLHSTCRGTTFYAEISLNTLMMKKTPLTQAIIHDITERVQALKEKDIMIREIHHRVKNNLQIIDSLLYLQMSAMESGEAESALMGTQRRIDVMAKLHELVYYHENLATISSAAYMQEVLSYFRNQPRSDPAPIIETELEDLAITPDQCVYLGIILSELVDNAVRHARPPADQEQKIEIRFRLRGNSVELGVRDNGIGWKAETLQNRKGLGLELIDALKAQLNGEISWEEETGNSVVFRAPIQRSVN